MCSSFAQNKTKVKPRVTLKEFFNPGGSIRLGIFENERYIGSKPETYGSSLWLNAKTKRIFNVSFTLDGYVQSVGPPNAQRSSGDMRELYSSGSLHSLDLKVGRQIIVWGRADKVNPTDSLSLKDLTLLVSNDEDQRLGLFSVQQIVNFSDNRLILVWQPEWRNPKFPLPSLPTGVNLTTTQPIDPDKQFAVKFDHSGGTVDYSLSYFSGYDKTPDLTLGSVGTSGVNVLINYNMIQVIGADIAFNLGSYGFRAELANTKTKDPDGTDKYIKNSYTYGVLGVDRTVGESTYLNFQMLFRSHQNWLDPLLLSNPLDQTLVKRANLLSNQTRAQQTGASLRITRNAFEQTLEMEVTYLIWFEQNSSIMRPKIGWQANDSFKVFFGGELYSGPDESYFGQFKNLSRYFTELRYSF